MKKRFHLPDYIWLVLLLAMGLLMVGMWRLDYDVRTIGIAMMAYMEIVLIGMICYYVGWRVNRRITLGYYLEFGRRCFTYDTEFQARDAIIRETKVLDPSSMLNYYIARGRDRKGYWIQSYCKDKNYKTTRYYYNIKASII